MLMAAGLGTRLKPFSDQVPKALVPVMGVPVAQFAIDALASAGVEEVVVNIHHLANLARVGFEKLDLHGMKLSFSDESANLLGSAGGLKKALPLFKGYPFYYLNADVISSLDIRELGEHRGRMKRQWNSLITMAVFPNPVHSAEIYREIISDPLSSLILSLGEKKARAPFFTGAAVIEPEAVAHLKDETPAELVPEILTPALQHSRACVFTSNGDWMDIGSPELWLKAHLNLIEGLERGSIKNAWRRRIEMKSERMGEKQWRLISSRSFSRARADWVGPCFFGGTEKTRYFGPKTVIYGKPPKLTLHNGIGLDGKFLEFV